MWTDKRGWWAVSIDGARSQSMSELSDDELLAEVRAGDRDAYGSLYERHAPSARRYARALLANRPDADDAVGEVFARLLQAIERGRGPDHTFAAYVFASVRHECVRIERRRSREALDRAPPHPVDARGATVDHAAGVAEAAVVRAAFASLPGEMRDILRLTEVDQLPQREIATRLAEDPGTVATRAMRARRALGSAYLRQHVGIGGHRLAPNTGCQDTQSHIASFLRGTTGSRRRARIEEHLATCAACRAECADLRRINGHLRSIASAVLATVRTAGEAAWDHVAAVAAASAAPLAAAGVVTATALAPVMVAPPPSTVPAPPVVVEEAPMRPELHLPTGLATAPAHPPAAPDTADGAPVAVTDIVEGVTGRSTGVASAPVGPTMAEEVTVLPPVTIAAAPVEDAAAPPTSEPDPAGSPSPAAEPSTDATIDATSVTADAPVAQPAESSGGAEAATPESTPPETTSPAPEVPITDPPAVAPPPTSADGGGATTVPHKPGPKAAPTDDEGGDPVTTIVVTLNPKADSHANRPVSSS